VNKICDGGEISASLRNSEQIARATRQSRVAVTTLTCTSFGAAGVERIRPALLVSTVLR
jgi:hypothetical protein